MDFSVYLANCRDTMGWTQERLVEELYLFDEETFSALSTGMLSRWERKVVVPSWQRQAALIHFFQNMSGDALPCMGKLSPESLERSLCSDGLHRLLGRPPTLYADIEIGAISGDDYTLMPLRAFERAEPLLELHQMIYQRLNPGFTAVSIEKFEKWSLRPGNFFQILLYKGMFLGLLFALRLKPETFEDIIHFRKRKNEISEKDFASMDEPASYYLLSAYALNRDFLAPLLARLYAHFLSHEKSIEKIGFITMQDDLLRLGNRLKLENILHRNIEGERVYSMAASLPQMMRGEEILRILFPRR